MRKFVRKNSALAVGLMALFAGVQAAAQTVENIRVGVTSKTATRIVLDIDAAVDFSLSPIATGAGALTIDLPKARATARNDWLARPSGHIEAISTSRAGDAAKVAISFRRTAKIEDVFLIEPNRSNKNHRLVVDLADGSMAAFLTSIPMPDEEPDMLAAIIEEATGITDARSAQSDDSAAEAPVLAQVELKKPVVVIDAGHGGRDPGAEGPSGLKESVVNLSAAKKLAEILEKSGRYEVVLTRDSDDKVSYNDRVRIAREADASLFISLHADAHEDPDLRGASVYTLSDEGTERSAREAKEQGDYVIFDSKMSEFDPVIGGILFDIAQDDTEGRSSEFAQILVNKLGGVTPLLNNTHRRGNLRVLLAPDVPAVLLELAFISNKKDEANLNSKAWRRKTMAAVAGAIDEYFEKSSGALVVRSAETQAAGGL